MQIALCLYDDEGRAMNLIGGAKYFGHGRREIWLVDTASLEFFFSWDLNIALILQEQENHSSWQRIMGMFMLN
jgi:hypothetical protein